MSVRLGRVRELMKLAQALLSYTEPLMTSFLTGHSSPGGEVILKPARVCVVTENTVHGKVNPLPYPDNYSRSGFAGVHGHADPSSDGTEQTPCRGADGGYLIYTNTGLVTELALAHT